MSQTSLSRRTCRKSKLTFLVDHRLPQRTMCDQNIVPNQETMPGKNEDRLCEVNYEMLIGYDDHSFTVAISRVFAGG